ncbi:nucleoside-diphosphate sugar epimerase [Corynebacterium frankenforstense DSM 45800]|uniref:Nucleoside-diphosphate sugar epimerase n=1 Tax=Corynebacterium frankenforstense DSM 45800 TaxID=1437875 RepID=A0A1L7CSD9_9CORY|nr:TIGR01777 family oxidoreductase [Corynebacterium frankenforstense]APT88757.1 nucleoside-diphosphate sugar epimerase [Corynebacterium frankenforstense DSM 45800]
MSLTTRHLVPADRAAVWRWHTRSGAVERLTPPFLPMTPLSQASSLADGTTVFGLPAGLRWEARHDLSGFQPGRSFVDVCVSAPVRALTQWRHLHRFADAPEGNTRITDEVTTRVPARSLAPAFAYRQHQLVADLEALRRLAAIARGGEINDAARAGVAGSGAVGAGAGTADDADAGRPLDLPALTVAVTGSSGTVGRALCAQLGTAGVRVVPLVRGEAGDGERHWDPTDPDGHLLDDVDALVHLAGEPIMGRFTDAHKAKLRDSRIGPTRRLAELVAASERCDVMVCASAVGWYGADRGDEFLGEDSEPGDGFLAELCAEWEAACAPARAAGKRVVNVRTGLVLSGGAGILPLYRVLFNTGLGGALGDGTAWLPWIALDDLSDIYVRAIVDAALAGPVNASAPSPVRAAGFAKALGREMHRPSAFPVPGFGPALLLGREGAEELALADQRVVPSRLEAAGHVFRYRELADALAHELGGEELADA